MDLPKTEASPLEALSNPVSMEIVVVFPAPLCPSRTEISLLYNENDIPFTAFIPFEKDFFKFFI